MANIVCKNWSLFQVEIKKKCYWNCWLGPSNRLILQIKLHPTSWQYPLINYLALIQETELSIKQEALRLSDPCKYDLILYNNFPCCYLIYQKTPLKFIFFFTMMLDNFLVQTLKRNFIFLLVRIWKTSLKFRIF